MASRLRRPLAAAVLGIAGATASLAAATGTPAGTGLSPSVDPLAAAVRSAAAVETPPISPAPRRDVPEDRYAPAGGCYVLTSSLTGRVVTTSGDGWTTTAERADGVPLRFQAYDLGKYLVLDPTSLYLAAESGLPDPRQPVRPVSGTVRGTHDETTAPARMPAADAVDTAAGTAAGARPAPGPGLTAAGEPGPTAEWLLREVPGGFSLRIPVDDGEPENPGPLEPAVAATLVADTTGALTAAPGLVDGPRSVFTLRRADACAVFPEISTDVSGPVGGLAAPHAQTTGYLDAHLHAMAFEFLGGEARCGRPWHPYGVAYALVDCLDHEPGGYGGVLEGVLSGTPGQGHDTVGWPTFGYWPKYSSLTHEQVYWKWLERAYRGGLRMYTNLLVDNGALCELYPYKRNSCNEMDGVRLQAQRLHELERYIDAQSGGPGEGWFRIVTDPFEARRVVNSGRLAVVMGVEVSVPFDCGETMGVARCTAADIDRSIAEVWDLGVRQMELTNKFDNALTGVTGDGGTTGTIVSQGNRYETGHYWQMAPCDEPAGHEAEGHRHDRTQLNLVDDGGAPRDSIFAGVLETLGTTGAAPAYGAGPHCNTIGLSDLGRYALDAFAARGMLFDPDHMSASARKAALEHLGKKGYSGLVSSHGWADDPTYRTILRAGGLVTPHAGSSTSIVSKWRQLRGWGDDRFVFGLGFGSDINGFSTQGGPRNPAEDADLDYPFTGFGGAVFDAQRSGAKTYDYNKSGVDHYGLYADWVEDARIVAGADAPAFLADLGRGVEAYLQTWERAIGVEGDACRPDVADLTRADLARVERGATPERVLALLGQPAERTARGYAYCVGSGTARVVVDPTGRVAGVSHD